jgi:hypothetical protein
MKTLLTAMRSICCLLAISNCRTPVRTNNATGSEGTTLWVRGLGDSARNELLNPRVAQEQIMIEYSPS